MKSIRLGCALIVASLAGCAGVSAPRSYIYDHQVYHPAIEYRYPVSVLAIDGSSPAFSPVPIAPGTHSVTFQTAPVAGFHVPVEKVYPMDIRPCSRYFVAAQRHSPTEQDWNLVIEAVEPVADCTDVSPASGAPVPKRPGGAG